MNSIHSNVKRLIEEHQSGFSLEQEFYCSDDVFATDIEQVFHRKWLLVDHVSRIPDRGDYFLFDFSGESIIVIRESDDTVNVFFNVCRHRGSRICLVPEGNERTLSCPYHAWTYDLNGKLRRPRLMPAGIETENYGLHAINCVIFHGLIFICFSHDPPDFDSEFMCLEEILAFHGIRNAKIAVKKDYPTNANWKLVVENFLECYHCAVAHPEYCSIHPHKQLLALGAGPGSGPPGAIDDYQPAWDEWKEKARALGHPLPNLDKGADSIHMSIVARFPVHDERYLSETRTGEPACRLLMGKFKEYDGGETAILINPFSFALAFNDFAVIIRFSPRDTTKTDVQFTWLVHEDAVEGRDFDPEFVCWAWDVTTRQDKAITENNQKGVRSSRYAPGPYSEFEMALRTFQKWYFNSLLN